MRGIMRSWSDQGSPSLGTGQKQRGYDDVFDPMAELVNGFLRLDLGAILEQRDEL